MVSRCLLKFVLLFLCSSFSSSHFLSGLCCYIYFLLPPLSPFSFLLRVFPISLLNRVFSFHLFTYKALDPNFTLLNSPIVLTFIFSISSSFSFPSVRELHFLSENSVAKSDCYIWLLHISLPLMLPSLPLPLERHNLLSLPCVPNTINRTNTLH